MADAGRSQRVCGRSIALVCGWMSEGFGLCPTHDQGRYQSVLAVLIEAGADLARDSHVSTWPEDEIDYYRNGEWRSFQERADRLLRLRQEKLARLLVATADASDQTSASGSDGTSEAAPDA